MILGNQDEGRGSLRSAAQGSWWRSSRCWGASRQAWPTVRVLSPPMHASLGQNRLSADGPSIDASDRNGTIHPVDVNPISARGSLIDENFRTVAVVVRVGVRRLHPYLAVTEVEDTIARPASELTVDTRRDDPGRRRHRSWYHSGGDRSGDRSGGWCWSWCWSWNRSWNRSWSGSDLTYSVLRGRHHFTHRWFSVGAV